MCSTFYPGEIFLENASCYRVIALPTEHCTTGETPRARIRAKVVISCSTFSNTLGGCPFHGRVERDEIPTRKSPPKQSGTLPCPPLHSTPVPSTPSACLLLSISMHTVCEVGELN